MFTHIICYLLAETHWIIGNGLLPNPDFPIIFESVSGECDQEFGDTSYFNEKEVSVVVKWVQKLSEINWKGKGFCIDDVGIVSPYKKQCALIQEKMRNNGFGDITIGPAEIFQGQERRIIIISTVRTGDHLGFVSNEQVKYCKQKHH